MSEGWNWLQIGTGTPATFPWLAPGQDSPLSATLFIRKNIDGTYVYCLRIGNDIGGETIGGTTSYFVAPDTGTVYFQQIQIITSDSTVSILPRHQWSTSGGTISVGDGTQVRNCIPPRSTIRIRWCPGTSTDPLLLRWPTPSFRLKIGANEYDMPIGQGAGFDWQADAVAIATKFKAALASGSVQQYQGSIPPTLAVATLDSHVNFGIWRPQLLALPDQSNGGGVGIEPFPWERVPEVIYYHDAAMERHAVSWRERWTGQPLPAIGPVAGGYYSLSRGWYATTVPQGVSDLDPAGGGGRTPKQWNPNSGPGGGANSASCPYELRLAGATSAGYYNGFPPHDGQHMIRATYRGRCAAELWGDTCAQDDLAMAAKDCLYSYQAVPSGLWLGMQHYGHPAVGREWAWVVETLVDSGNPIATQFMTQAALAQPAHGVVQRHPYDDGWSPNPSPWNPVQGGMFPNTVEAAQTMEAVFVAYSFARTRKVAEAANTMQGLLPFASQLGFFPKFVGVAPYHGAPFPTLTLATGATSANDWGTMGVGLMATVQPSVSTTWLDYQFNFGFAGLAFNANPGPAGNRYGDILYHAYQAEGFRSQVVLIAVALEQLGGVTPVDY